MRNEIVFAVVITYNPDVALLGRQIKSLLGQVEKIIIIDNNSSGFSEMKNFLLQENNDAIDKFIFIANTANMGLGTAQNQGIRRSMEMNASHVLILDQDSVLDDGFVESLLLAEKTLEARGNRVGALGPVYYNGVTGEVYPITKFNGPFIQRIQPTTEPGEASFLISSGCLIKTTILAETGLMNEDLFIDYIDVEWSFRVRSKGYKIYACPTAKMKHQIGDQRASIFGRSISVHSPLRRYYLCRNSIYMIRRSYIPIGYKIRETVFNSIRFVIFSFFSKEKMKYFKYCINGYIDGLKGVKGICPHKFD